MPRLTPLLWVLALVVAGCATYASRIREPRFFLETGQYDSAITALQDLSKLEDNDQLLYLMDLGLAYHRAGKYLEATEVFLKADRLAEIKDYTSISQEAASILLSDEVKPYKGEDFEKILINVYLAIDFALAGRWESALVECRKVNHKLDQMIQKGKLPYERNAFAKYLAAVLFEAQGELNDAFVDYRQLLKWRGSQPYLGPPLLRLASRMGASQEFRLYRKKFPGVKDYRISRKEGQVVLLLEQGKVPIKVPHPNFRLMPKFQKRHYRSQYALLRTASGKGGVERSQTLFDIESTAIKELDSRIAGIAAKKIGGVVLKEVVAQQVAKHTDSEAMGLITKLLLTVQDQADLRSWSTLPAQLQIARLTLPAGTHDLVLDVGIGGGKTRKKAKVWKGFEVKPGRIHFVNYRAGN